MSLRSSSQLDIISRDSVSIALSKSCLLIWDYNRSWILKIRSCACGKIWSRISISRIGNIRSICDCRVCANDLLKSLGWISKGSWCCGGCWSWTGCIGTSSSFSWERSPINRGNISRASARRDTRDISSI